MKLWPWALGAGMAAGAVAILMMPNSNPTRRLAAQAAQRVEDTVNQWNDPLSN